MSDQTEQETTVTDETQAEQQPEQETQQAEERSGNKEAAKYRTRLRETETERDALSTQLENVRTEHVKQILTSGVTFPVQGNNGHTWNHTAKLRNPEDLFTVGGVDRASLWKSDGTIDAEKLQTAVAALKDTRPELFVPNGPIIPTIGDTPDTYPSVNESWQGAFTAR